MGVERNNKNGLTGRDFWGSHSSKGSGVESGETTQRVRTRELRRSPGSVASGCAAKGKADNKAGGLQSAPRRAASSATAVVIQMFYEIRVLYLLPLL